MIGTGNVRAKARASGLFGSVQTGGVGMQRGVVPVPFTPTSIAGMQIWYKADTGLFQDSAKTTPATANAHPVGAWEDQSGNGNDILQTTSNRRPFLTAAGLNGHSFISNAANNEYMVKAVLSIAQPYTFFAVTRLNPLNTGNHLYTAGKGNIFYDAGGPRWYMQNGGNVFSSGTATTAWTYITAVCTTSTSKIRQNGGNEGSGATTGGTLTLLSFMASDGGFGADSANSAHYAEFLLYSGALTALQITNVEDYLKTRFGL